MAVLAQLCVVVVVVNCLNINLSNRNLTTVPSNINPNVTTLFLNNNKIGRISVTSLMFFRELTALLITTNMIRYVDEAAFDYNPKLSQLHLSINHIDSMTSTFGAAHSSLVVINLWAALTPDGARSSNFSRCKNLQTLIIGYNGYYTLDASILPPSLITLNMKYSGLKEFPDLTHEAPNLKNLQLQGNSISSIPTERIQGLKYLEKLYIAGNKIQVLPDLIKTSIKEIDLAGNPFTCDSHVCELHMLYDLGILDVLDEPVCETPETYKGQMVLVMNISGLACPGKSISIKMKFKFQLLTDTLSIWGLLYCSYSVLLTSSGVFSIYKSEKAPHISPVRVRYVCYFYYIVLIKIYLATVHIMLDIVLYSTSIYRGSIVIWG